MADETARASASAGKTIEAIGPDVKRFTSETLPELELLLGEASLLTSSLRRLSEHIERSPGGLLIGRRPLQPGPGE
jgi:phospholipid/cholesterol/gamma-HCH transport system substrate-binding protein